MNNMLRVTPILIKKIPNEGTLTVWSIKNLFIVWQKDLADLNRIKNALFVFKRWEIT